MTIAIPNTGLHPSLVKSSRIKWRREGTRTFGERVLCYQAGTLFMKLCITQSTHHALTLSACTDAEYAGQDSDRKSISAAAVQSMASLPTGTAPSRSTSNSIIRNKNFLPPLAVLKNSMFTNPYKKSAAPGHNLYHYVWIIKPLSRRLRPKPHRSAQNILTSSEFFLKDRYYKGRIIHIHVPTKYMLVDLMTKALPTPDFRRLCRMIGLTAPSRSADGTPRGGVLE